MKIPPPTGIGEFHRVVLDLCARHDATVSSWIRAPWHNAEVGGDEDSKHLPDFGGMAVDFALSPDADDPVHRAALIADCRAAGLWTVDEGDHVHAQGIKPGTPRPASGGRP